MTMLPPPWMKAGMTRNNFTSDLTYFIYLNDFTTVVFNFQYEASYIIIHNQTISPT